MIGSHFALLFVGENGLTRRRTIYIKGVRGLLFNMLFFNDFYFDFSDEFHQPEWSGLFFF